ncbi:MAG: hypothetical protein ACI9F9_001789 [Candidatus Paceibacteria bacterium]|jgi:hypothetical protein
MSARLALMMGAVAALASSASACPTCSVGQGLETLIYVLGFLGIPYLVVTGVLFWMRKVTSQEHGL